MKLSKRLSLLSLLTGAGLAVGCSGSHHPTAKVRPDVDRQEKGQLAAARQFDQSVPSVGNIETVMRFDGPMPTGVTVSQDGRIFVNFPRWGDKVDFTVGEIKGGGVVPYPNAEINQYATNLVATNLVSVQSVVVDPANRLWMLDTGSIQLGPAVPGGPKMVGVDLRTNQVVKTITFPGDVAQSTTYLNDVRFDLTRGKGGTAYITDSGSQGPNGIIVVDLDSGRSWRKLSGHPSVRADDKFVPTVEGQPLLQQPVAGVKQYLTMGSDGIAISNDGKRLFFCPLASHRLYSVSTDALADPATTDDQVAATIQELPRDYASDGLESDAAGNLYLTDYEHNAVHRRSPATPDGRDTIIAQDPRMIWPDTLSLSADGYVYFTANQLDRQKTFHQGEDLREKPYYLFRVKVDARPVMLK